ncbi:MAG TPA: RpiB/LacA/LacB family sugar-phosphate isomerase [Candidatus Paceibacterota bacterium]
MKIYFASDHAGFEMKNALVGFAKGLDFEVIDLGPEKLNLQDDYPLEIEKVGMEIFKNPSDRGVVLGGSGQGEAIVANRFPNVRAAVYYGGNEDVLRLSRKHNDANVLSLGARFLSLEEAKGALKFWLETPFSGDRRHVRRLQEIDEMEESLYKNP